MKNLQEKMAKLVEFLELDAELKEKLEPIIKNTYDYSCDGIEGYDISEDGKYIDCHYSYTDWCHIPVKWLEDGYDYKAEFEEMKRKSEEERKRREEEGQDKKEKEKAEYETYLKLKEKYEDNVG